MQRNTPPSLLFCIPQKWLNGVGKAQGRKGKRLFMPMRIVLTGRMQVREQAALFCVCMSMLACLCVSMLKCSHTHACLTALLKSSASSHTHIQGPEVGDQLQLLAAEEGDVCEGVSYTSLAGRMEALKSWLAKQ